MTVIDALFASALFTYFVAFVATYSESSNRKIQDILDLLSKWMAIASFTFLVTAVIIGMTC